MNTSKIEAALKAKLVELEARAEGIEHRLSEAPDSDWEENAKDSEDDDVLSSLGDLTMDDIHHVKLAISRIESGMYGICLRCEGQIGSERLKALPTSTACIKCA